MMEDTNSYKTLLKFQESQRNGDPIGFVFMNKRGELLGIGENDSREKRKICILSKEIDKSAIELHRLYEVRMVDMPNHKGYIVQTLKKVQHRAKVTLEISETNYQAVFTFGNKKFYYNPLKGKSEFSSTKDGVLSLINACDDIEDRENAISRFKKAMDKIDDLISKFPKGTVETMVCSKCYYQTIIKFGKTKLVYNPFDGPRHESDLKVVMRRLNNLVGLSNKEEVIESVLRSAKNIHARMEGDGYIVPKYAI